MKKLTVALLALILLLTAAMPALAASDFAFAERNITIFEGETITPALLRQNGAATGEVTFSSANQRVATVDAAGVVTGLTKGKTTINAALKVDKKSYKAQVNVNVLRAVTEIQLDDRGLTLVQPGDPLVEGLLQPMEDSDAADYPILVLSAGRNTQLKLSALPKDASDRKVVVTSTDETIVRVVEGTTLQPKMAGECIVTVASRQNPEVVLNYRVLVTQPVKSLKITADSKKVAAGGTLALRTEVAPDNATIKDVTWTSGQPKVATVDANGVVTGVSKGTATIKAMAADGSGRNATYQVQVVQQPASITLSETDTTVAVGYNKQLKATVNPSSTNDKTVVWSSSNEAIAKVNSQGRITPVSAGECTITCASKDFPEVRTTARVVVTQPITKISFNEREVTVNVGSTTRVYWTTSPADATNTSVVLASANDKIATVDQDGTIHGMKRGSTNITVTANDGSKKRATIKVNVLQPVTGVHMKNDTLTIDLEEPVTLTAVLEPSDASNNRMTWVSDDPRVLTVKGTKNKPTVTGHAWGTAIITGTTEDGGYTTEATINVGNYDKALMVNDFYLQNHELKITVVNVSNLDITRFNFEVRMFDLYNAPLPCNYNGNHVFTGVYAYKTLYEGNSTMHGRFTFHDYMQPIDEIGRMELRITGYTTEDGYVRNIREDKQVVFEYKNPAYQGDVMNTLEPIF